VVGNNCRALLGFSTLFIGEKTFSFIFIFYFLKKVLKYPEKNADRGFFCDFAKSAKGIGVIYRWVFGGCFLAESTKGGRDLGR